MLVSVKYTDKEIQEMLKNMIVICDTREQENSHIINTLDKKKWLHKTRAMETGDYTAELIIEGKTVSFDKAITIDRKASLDELAGNLTHDRSRFEQELQRAKSNNTKFILLIEDNSWEDIYLHNYRSQFNEKSFIGTLQTYINRYKIDIQFISKKNSAGFIYQTLYYYLREHLKE